MNWFKIILAIAIIALALVGVVYTLDLQSRLDKWRGFGTAYDLGAVADGIYELLVILYVFCAVLVLVGLYILVHK
jgi:hypothetical protein